MTRSERIRRLVTIVAVGVATVVVAVAVVVVIRSVDDGAGHEGDGDRVADGRPRRCDLGFNTACYNDVAPAGDGHDHVHGYDDDGNGSSFTIDEWAEIFADRANGVSPEALIEWLEPQSIRRGGILSGGLGHRLEPEPWEPMTDPAACRALADEVEAARATAARYPTAADALAAGYYYWTPYLAGIGAHYIRYDLVDDRFVAGEPEILTYDGDGEGADLVGLSYYVLHDGDQPPTVGFSGPNDHWHRHRGLCRKPDGFIIGPSSTTTEECAALGGAKADGGREWMGHLWIVPGCENDWGLFSDANPALKERLDDTFQDIPKGCRTGQALNADLDLDEGTPGPEL